MPNVEYLDHMGVDHDIVDAARVSFNKSSDQYSDQANSNLLKFLRNHEHWSPYAHVIVKFRVTAPIYVARQLFKHQIGFAVNEISRRYVSDSITFELPQTWRAIHPNKKQGSAEPIPTEAQHEATRIADEVVQHTFTAYNGLLDIGIAPEQARAVLPLSLNTSWIWTGSLEGWFRVCRLRLPEDAQQETREVAHEVAKHIQQLFPVAWQHFENYYELSGN